MNNNNIVRNVLERELAQIELAIRSNRESFKLGNWDKKSLKHLDKQLSEFEIKRNAILEHINKYLNQPQG